VWCSRWSGAVRCGPVWSGAVNSQTEQTILIGLVLVLENKLINLIVKLIVRVRVRVRVAL